VGTSGKKIVAINEDGKVVASVTKNYDLKSPNIGLGRTGPSGLEKAVLMGLLKFAKNRWEEVRSIGLTGQMHGSVFLMKKEGFIPSHSMV
jgi:xylulokinase